MASPYVGYNGGLYNNQSVVPGPYAVQVLNATTLALDGAVDSNTITLTAGHGTVVGNYLVISAGVGQGEIYLGTALSVAVNVITLDTPLNFSYLAGSTVLITNNSMNLDGSSTPITFEVGPPDNQNWDLTRIMMVMLTDTQPDDASFGDLAALTNGLVCRTKRNGADRFNLFNFKRQFDIRAIAYDVTYSDNAGPQSEWGVACRVSYGGRDKHGQPIRLFGASNDTVQFIIQDDLTGLVDFSCIIEGNVESEF